MSEKIFYKDNIQSQLRVVITEVLLILKKHYAKNFSEDELKSYNIIKDIVQSERRISSGVLYYLNSLVFSYDPTLRVECKEMINHNWFVYTKRNRKNFSGMSISERADRYKRKS